MTLYLSCQDMTKAFGSRNLFKGLSLSLFEGDRVGLIGPNGSGKSTLLKIMAGLETADLGTVAARRGLKIGYVPQECRFEDKKPVQILKEVLTDEREGYEKERLAETWLSKLGFTGEEASAATLSGGWQKRLSFAVALIQEPDLLLLDEPTNHLDLEGILWLEKFLAREAPTYLLVSHDRYFLHNMVNRVIEINTVYPEGLFTVNGSYDLFLEKKEGFLEGQLSQERSLASKARRELSWLRESPKARTTKAQSRIDGAHAVLDGLAAIRKRNRQKKTAINFSASERETKKLLVLKNISKGHLFQHLDLTLSPGMKLGLMGPNGSGKTTLLRLLAGEIAPDQGTIKTADALKIVYFDQHRVQLPPHITLRTALSPEGDFVSYHGQMIHVNGWCKRFLFTPEDLDRPISSLSGGERARIAVAHLMLQPADLLLLDEPTNDLDIPTLETLEESLLEFPGAVILITHDRAMMDRVCTSLLALGGQTPNTLFADYTQWERATPKPPSPPEKKPKPSYKEKKENAEIEAQIIALEEEVKALNAQLGSVEGPELQELCTKIGLAETRIEELYLRWLPQ